MDFFLEKIIYSWLIVSNADKYSTLYYSIYFISAILFYVYLNRQHVFKRALQPCQS